MNKLFPIVLALLFFSCEDKLEQLKYRLHTWENVLETITADNKRVIVRSQVQWKVSDVRQFYRTGLDIYGVQSILDDLFDESIRDVISRQHFDKGIENFDVERAVQKNVINKLDQNFLGIHISKFTAYSILEVK